ncbi:hypothetical protein D0Y65_012890, partial [Glycine soja]
FSYNLSLRYHQFLFSEWMYLFQKSMLLRQGKAQNHICIGITMPLNLLTTKFPCQPLIHPRLHTSLMALVLSPTTLFLLVSPLN